MNVELLDKAVASALCPTFKALVEGSNTVMVYSGAASLIPGAQPVSVPVLKTAVSVLALSQLGASATCADVEIGPEPPNLTDGCWEVDNAAICWIENRNSPGTKILGIDQDVKKIISVEPGVTGDSGPETPTSIATLELTDGSVVTANSGVWPYDEARWYLEPLPGSTCVSDGGGLIPDNPEVPDVTYIDQSTNCGYVVKFLGLISEQQGASIQPVYQIESQAVQRADGGRMGGCFLGPTIYTPGPNGPGGPGGPPIPPVPIPPIVPGPDDDGIPWWAKALLQGATGAALNLIGQEIRELTRAKYEAGTFTLTAPCDYTEEGDNVSYFFPFPKGTFEQRVIDHQMAILDVLQYHLNSKTPTCGNEKPPLEGQWVTTRWLSTEKMDHSGVRLRKLFRYRTKSTRNLGQLSAYWEAFTWEAGPVCVRHTGAWWGDPQIWAASQEEGQRVIRFAAAEAGLDPDQDGEWRTSSSRSPRYGMSGTMTIHLKDGYPWVSAREGDSWPNTLARAHDPEGRSLFSSEKNTYNR